MERYVSNDGEVWGYKEEMDARNDFLIEEQQEPPMPNPKDIQMKTEICQLCKEEIKCPDFGDGTFDYSDIYEYRGFTFHEKCFDEGVKKVDNKRQEVMEVTEHSIRSQADGEWQNGGYKTMKTDAGGRPITKVKEPMILQNYEQGKL